MIFQPEHPPNTRAMRSAVAAAAVALSQNPLRDPEIRLTLADVGQPPAAPLPLPPPSSQTTVLEPGRWQAQAYQ